MIRRRWVLVAVAADPSHPMLVRLAHLFNAEPQSYYRRRSAVHAARFYERTLGIPLLFYVRDDATVESSSPEVMEYKAQRPSMTATAMRTIARPRSGRPPFLACAPPPAGRCLAALEAEAPAAEPARVSSDTLSVEFSGFTLVTYATLVLRINYLGYFPARRAACLRAPRAGAAAVQPGGDGIGRPRGRREAG